MTDSTRVTDHHHRYPQMPHCEPILYHYYETIPPLIFYHVIYVAWLPVHRVIVAQHHLPTKIRYDTNFVFKFI